MGAWCKLAKRKATTKKVGQEYWKQRERVLRRVREIEKRGYIVDRSFIPDLPDKISAKDVKALKEITPNIIYKNALYVSQSTGEVRSGYEGRKLERQQAAYKGVIRKIIKDSDYTVESLKRVQKARKFLTENPENPRPETTKIEEKEPETQAEDDESIIDYGEPETENYDDIFEPDDEDKYEPKTETKKEYPKETDVVVDNLADDLGIELEYLEKLEDQIDNFEGWGVKTSAQELHDFNNAKAGDVLTRALQILGREQVAKNIQENADRVYELVNIIRTRYSKTYITGALAEFQQILMGNTDDSEWFQSYQEANGEMDYNVY